MKSLFFRSVRGLAVIPTHRAQLTKIKASGFDGAGIPVSEDAAEFGSVPCMTLPPHKHKPINVFVRD